MALRLLLNVFSHTVQNAFMHLRRIPEAALLTDVSLVWPLLGGSGSDHSPRP